MSINWEEINAKLPTGTSQEEKAQRLTLFKQFDNGNGFLSLAEVSSIEDYLQATDDGNPIDLTLAVTSAFDIAKSATKSGISSNNNYIELSEFRFFLLSLRQYLEYYVAFTRIDNNSSHRITLDEFKKAQENIEKWVGSITPEDEFNTLDKNGDGYILFDEFINWAINKSLDIEDDVE
jgi:hypothetical protein